MCIIQNSALKKCQRKISLSKNGLKPLNNRGLVNSDEIARLNPELVETSKSNVLNVALKKDGGISATYKNGVYTTEELKLFKNFVWEKIQEAGKGIPIWGYHTSSI